MTLVNRVSAFFLVALALALISYSAVFYVLVRNYLNRRFDEDLHNALQILSSSVEVEPDDAKWDPAEHGIDLHQRILNEVIWVVANEEGHAVDRSLLATRQDPVTTPMLEYARKYHPSANGPADFGNWRVMQVQLSAPNPKPMAIREPHEYASLLITVARPRGELQTTLRRLGTLVIILPAIVWLTSAVIGRWFVRHALQPVREMADRARSATKADFTLRLPVADSRDELSELAITFNGLLSQLQMEFDRQQRFTGDAAHQLRTPLSVLQGQIDVALRRERSGEEYQRTLHVLADQTRELRQTVESLLFLARAGADSVAPNGQTLNVNQWFADYVEHWKEHERSADLRFSIKSNGVVHVSPPLLSQLLDNLVGNALKYSPSGSPVIVSSEEDDSWLRIDVEDRGPGIRSEEIPSIFEPFFRSESARRSGITGTGLGLSVANRIAAVLGGRISCRSDLGQGSTFSLWLPIHRLSEANCGKTAEQNTLIESSMEA